VAQNSQSDAIRPQPIGTLEETRARVADFVGVYNHHRLYSASDYVTPADKLAGHAEAIPAGRDRKLEAARERRPASKARARAPHVTSHKRSAGHASRSTGVIWRQPSDCHIDLGHP